MDISIRPEDENDFRNVENMIREAFWDLYKPGCVVFHDEAELDTPDSFYEKQKQKCITDMKGRELK